MQSNNQVRQQSLSQIQGNKLFSLTVHAFYVRHSQLYTTILTQAKGEQFKISLPECNGGIRKEIEAGRTYFFKYCKKKNSEYVEVLCCNNRIYNKQVNQNYIQVNRTQQFSQIILNYQTLAQIGKYFDTLLYVIQVGKTKKMNKYSGYGNNNKVIQLTVLQCFAYGSIVQVSVWGSNIDLNGIQNKWNLFSGFKVKYVGLKDKFTIYSSVYSSIERYQGQVLSRPYYPQFYLKYGNCSKIYYKRSIRQLSQVNYLEQNLYSEVEVQLLCIQHNECQRKVESITKNLRTYKEKFLRLHVCDYDQQLPNQGQQKVREDNIMIKSQNKTIATQLQPKLDQLVKKQQPSSIFLAVFGADKTAKIEQNIKKQQQKQLRQYNAQEQKQYQFKLKLKLRVKTCKSKQYYQEKTYVNHYLQSVCVQQDSQNNQQAPYNQEEV